MDNPESSAKPAHPPPGEARARPTTGTRTCPSCEGEGYAPIDHRYDPKTGLLTIVGGLCCCCQGTGELVVYLYRGGGA